MVASAVNYLTSLCGLGHVKSCIGRVAVAPTFTHPKSGNTSFLQKTTEIFVTQVTVMAVQSLTI